MILPGTAMCGVGGGVDAGEGFEIVGKVRLVVVVAVEGQIGPTYICAAIKSSKSGLETLETAPGFGSDADGFAEDAREPAFTDAQRFRALADGELFFGEKVQGLVDDWGTARVAGKKPGEEKFESAQLHCGRRRFAELVGETFASPEILQGSGLFE